MKATLPRPWVRTQKALAPDKPFFVYFVRRLRSKRTSSAS